MIQFPPLKRSFHQSSYHFSHKKSSSSFHFWSISHWPMRELLRLGLPSCFRANILWFPQLNMCYCICRQNSELPAITTAWRNLKTMKSHILRGIYASDMLSGVRSMKIAWKNSNFNLGPPFGVMPRSYICNERRFRWAQILQNSNYLRSSEYINLMVIGTL